MTKTLFLKLGVGGLLVIQCIFVALSVWLIVVGRATWILYVNIAINIAFGALNIKTLAE